MNEEQRAALLIANSVAAMIEAMGMGAENQYRMHRGESIAFDDKAFCSLIDKYGIGHNAALTTLSGG